MRWASQGSAHDLNFTNRPVRTRLPGGVAGAAGVTRRPYADCAQHVHTQACLGAPESWEWNLLSGEGGAKGPGIRARRPPRGTSRASWEWQP
jgi:hypothetical protein